MGVVTFIGVGDPFRSDDRVGRYIVERLRERGIPADRAIASDGDGAALLELLDREGSVILFDAARSGEAPGTVHRIEADKTPLPPSLTGSSSHLFGVAEAIEMARTLGKLPQRLVVYAIAGGAFDYGETMSEGVVAAADRLLEEVALRLVTGDDG